MTADTAGGVWIYALALCRALAPAGISVRLVALGDLLPAQRATAREVGNVELVECPVRLEWMSEPWHDLDRLEGELLRQVDVGDCDLVHLNHLVHGHLDWQRPVVCAVHSCVLSWFEAVRGERAPPSWDEYRQRVARSLGAADHVVAPSRWMLDRARQLYGPFRAGSVIANGSDAPLVDPRAGRDGVLAAGRVWDDAKNLQPLAAMAERLSAPLRIAGPARSPDGQRVEIGARRLGNLDQQRLWASMGRSSLFVAPALYEPFGLGILEAARSGCALVLGDIPSLRELWDGAAWFVDPRRPQTWQQAVEQLLHDREQRLRYAMAARQRATGYSLERMAQAYLSLYRDTIDLTAARTAGRKAS
ncbi:MAG: glycosyltransferase family 4 protein [Pseudomonadales bacterium]